MSPLLKSSSSFVSASVSPFPYAPPLRLRGDSAGSGAGQGMAWEAMSLAKLTVTFQREDAKCQ